MPEIDWHEPASLEEALDLLATHGEEARAIAGGTWLTLVLRQGLLAPTFLVSLHRISGLDQIQVDPAGFLHLGAMARHRGVERSPLVRERFPVVAETYAEVANVRVRNQATVAGNLCDADYASDPPAMLAALGATVRVISQRGRREISIHDLIIGHYQTALAPDELLTEVIIPPLPAHPGTAYLKYRTRSSEDRPCVGVAAVVALEADGRCQRLEVVVGAVADRLQRFEGVLAQASGRHLDEAAIEDIAAAYARDIEPLSDLRGSAGYRRRMIRVLVARAVRAAIGENRARIERGGTG